MLISTAQCDNENKLRELLPDTSPDNDLLTTWEENLLKGGELLLSERDQLQEQQYREGRLMNFSIE